MTPGQKMAATIAGGLALAVLVMALLVANADSLREMAR